MARHFLHLAFMVSLMLCLPLADCYGRGFGGGGRGGGGRGGFGGGGFGGGGGRGGFSEGGGRGGSGGGVSRSPGGFDGGGGRGSFGGGGSRGGGFGGGTGRGQGGFGGGQRGGPGAAGPGGGRMGAGGFGGQRGGERPGGFGAGGPGGSGNRGPGFQGRGGNQFASPNRGQLNSFLGLPSDGGLHNLGSAGVGRGNLGVGGDFGVGGVGRPGVGVGGVGRPGVGVGGVGRPGVGVGGVGEFAPISASARYTTATAVRGSYDHWGLYGRGWYARYPGAWFAAGWAAGTPWRACAWADAAAYCGYADAAPVYYDYGNTVTYQDNSVYVNGQDVGTGEQYYEQAASIASTGSAAEASSEGDWLPLGVFALTKPDEDKSDVSLQLAVNKQGVIRGNSTDTVTNKNQVIQGSVDKQTQRVAFTVGDNKQNVVETGLYNLTKDEAPCLIHFGQDKTQQWLLVRMHKPDSGS